VVWDTVCCRGSDNGIFQRASESLIRIYVETDSNPLNHLNKLGNSFLDQGESAKHDYVLLH
jgi:hypothetical protein